MSIAAKCSKCHKTLKAFQKLLVYEPVDEKICRVCVKKRPYPSAPPFGTSIKVCTYQEMERLCFPKLCNCPAKEPPLCQSEMRKIRLCNAIKMLAVLSFIAFLWDTGILRHPIYTFTLTEEIKEKIGDNLTTTGQSKPSLKEEYDMAVKTYNLANVWNAFVMGVGDLLLYVVKIPQTTINYIAEQMRNEPEEPKEQKKNEPSKDPKKNEPPKKK